MLRFNQETVERQSLFICVPFMYVTFTGPCHFAWVEYHLTTKKPTSNERQHGGKAVTLKEEHEEIKTEQPRRNCCNQLLRYAVTGGKGK